MGTTLTGTTPQDTYDSLIKVTDNGPLSSTLKKLTDGLGNDSSLSLSTTAASLSGTLAVTGNATFDTNTLFVDAATNRVGVLTTSPTEPLHVEGNISLAYGSSLKAANATYTTLLETGYNGSSDFVSLYTAGNNAGNATAKITMLANGNVGIGTSSPNRKLTVNGDLGTQDIVCDTAIYLGGTAAANALDDYEEGTFTATLKGTVSDPTTPVTTTGSYTKIGRQVTVRADFVNVNTSGASGDVSVSGMPFTGSGQSVGSVMLFSFDLDTSTAQNSYIGASTLVEFFGQKDDAGWVTLKHNAGAGRYLIFTITYFV